MMFSGTLQAREAIHPIHKLPDRPMHISQIFIADAPENRLPPALESASNTIRAAFPNAHHTLFNRETLRAFISQHYDSEVTWAFDKLRPYAYKADLGRYCLLNAIGGWYFDISIRCINTFHPDEDITFLAFRDIQRCSLTSWACSNTILYSRPDNHALQTALANIVHNCKTDYYGITPLCPTGPTLLGQALAIHGGRSDFIYGDVLELTPNHEKKNRAFVLPDGMILAWSKPAEGGDLTKFDARGTNNYNTFWHEMEVYAQNEESTVESGKNKSLFSMFFPVNADRQT